jgi:hypothetical protein
MDYNIAQFIYFFEKWGGGGRKSEKSCDKSKKLGDKLKKLTSLPFFIQNLNSK